MSIAEDRFLQGVLSRDKRPLTECEQALFDHFEERNRAGRVALKSQALLEEFSQKNIYDKGEIVANMQQVKRERMKHGDKTERGILFENIFGAYVAQAFKGMTCRKTEDYDDFFNHIDFILSGKAENGEDFFLGVDTTTSNNAEELKKKIGAISEDFERGNLGRVKYFKSEKTGELGLLDFVPRVVVSFNSQALSNLSEKLLEVVKGKKDWEAVINEQSSLLVMFEDIKGQLEEAKKYIESNEAELENAQRTNVAKMHHAVALGLKKIEAIIEEIQNKKTSTDETVEGEPKPARRRVIIS